MARLRSSQYGFFLALAAVFLLTAGPWFPLLAAQSGNRTLIEICTASGLKTVALDQGGAKEHAPGKPNPHCPFCLVRAALALLPPPVAIPAPRDGFSAAAFAVERPFILPPASLIPGRSPRPPPVFS